MTSAAPAGPGPEGASIWRRDPWIPVAWALVAAELCLLLYIGSRTGGPGPVKAYLFGPTLLMGLALLVGVAGILWSMKHPPLSSGRRTFSLLALVFVFMTSGYPYPFPCAREERPSQVRFQLPVEGEWTAAWGGDDTQVNLLARSVPARRYALCLVLAEDGRTEAADAEGSAGLERFLAFGRAVTAPAAGRVVEVVDRFEDGEVTAFGDDLGNRVVLEVAEGEYLFVANLARGSIAVERDQRVEVGAPLGTVGSSARSRFLQEPHLALHLQDSLDPMFGQGVPWFLHDVELNGRPTERAMPRGGGRGESGYGGQRIQRKAR